MMDLTLPDFTRLPQELQQAILQHLTAKDLCQAALCNQSWREAANRETLWHPLCRVKGWEHYGTVQDLRKETPFVPTSQQGAGNDNISFPFDAVVTGSNCPKLVPTCKWKEVYMKAKHLEANWNNNRYHSVSFEFGSVGYKGTWPDTVESETSDPNNTGEVNINSLDGEGDLLVGSLSNDTLRIWDNTSGKCQHIIKVDVSSCVDSLKVKNGVVAVGCQDGKVRTFSAKTAKQLRVMSGHDQEVSHLFFDGKTIVSSANTEIFVDEDDEEEDEEDNDEDDEGVKADKDDEDDDDEDDEGDDVEPKESDIRVWGSDDASDYLLRSSSRNTCLVHLDYKDNLVAAAYKPKTIRLWDTRNGTCLHTIKTDMNRLVSCHLGDGIVVGTNDRNDPVMKMWNLSSGECMETFDFADINLYREAEDTFEVSDSVSYSFDAEHLIMVVQTKLGVLGLLSLDGKYIGDSSGVNKSCITNQDPQALLKLVITCLHGNKVVASDFLEASQFLLTFTKDGGFKLVRELRATMMDEMDDTGFNTSWMSGTKLAFVRYFEEKKELKDQIQIPKIIVHHYW